MPPEQVDVNVHPSKMEVRFTDRRAVVSFLDNSVHNALRQIELIPKASLNTAKEERAQKRKEARLKQEHLQAAPHIEAFEKDRTDRPYSGPAVSSRPSVPPAGQNAGDPLSVSSEGRTAADPLPVSSAGPGFASSDIPVSSDTSSSPSATSYPQKTEEADGFIFEDKRLYKSDSAREDDRKSLPDERPAPAPEAEDALPQGQLSLENLFAAAAVRDDSEKAAQSEHILTQEKAQRYKYIGQVFGTYWIIEYENRLLIIDQHAAHEKVNYERMMRRIEREHPSLGQDTAPKDAVPQEYLALDRLLSKEKKDHAGLNEDGQEHVFVASQQLMPPMILQLSGREETAYLQFSNVFAAMGYEIEDFGGGSYAIRAVPTELFGQTADSLLREILEEIMNERISGTPGVVISKIASMACKASVKGSSSLTEKEARVLIDELLSLENPYHCPHGRPTMIIMTQYEMDRKFKRIV